MGVTEEILIRLRVLGQGQAATALGGVAKQADQVETSAAGAGTAIDTSGKKAKTARGAFAQAAGSLGRMAAAAGGVFAAQQVLKDSISNAVNLGEQINKTAVVFRGPGANSIREWSKTTATALGISREQALESAGVFGNMLVPMGIGRTRAAELSKGMVNLSADMASFNNASPEETLDALRSGLAGETEPLRKFGVFLNEARIKQQALRMGLYDGTGQLSSQAKALATHALIMKDTTDAQGDFQRTSGSLANQQRILRAQYANATAQLGSKLIPVLSLLVKNLDAVVVVVGLLAAAWLVYKAATIQAAIANVALNATFLANPIFLIIAAVVALAAALFIAYKKSATFRRIVDGVWAALKKAAAAVWRMLVPALKILWTVIKNTPLLLIIRNLGKIVAFVRSMPGKISRAASGMWDGIKDAFRSAINWIIRGWNSLEFQVPKIKVPGPIPDIPGFTLGTPDIGLLARGGTVARGGLAMVGEAGPELLNLPRGAQVAPLGPAPAISAAGGGGARTINVPVYLNGRQIAQAVADDTADRRARR